MAISRTSNVSIVSYEHMGGKVNINIENAREP